MGRRHLNTMKRSARQRALVDAAVVAFGQWRQECAAVRNACRRWTGASAVDRRFAFAAYNAALDREEHAARRYASLMNRARRLPTTALADQLAQIEVGSLGLVDLAVVADGVSSVEREKPRLIGP